MSNYELKFREYFKLCHTSKVINKSDYYNMINNIYDEYTEVTNNYIDYINKIQNSIGYNEIPNINIRLYNARINLLKILEKNNINFYNFNIENNEDYLFTLAIEDYLYQKYCEATKYIEDYLDVSIDLDKKYSKKINKFKFMIGKLSILSDLKNNQKIINDYKNVCDSLDNIMDKSEILNMAISYLNNISNGIDEKDKAFVISSCAKVYAKIFHILKCDSEIKRLLEESYKLTNKKVLKK